MAEALGLDHPTGIVVDDLYPGSPAAAAGLKRGDVIIAINGKSVEDAGSLRFRLATLDVGTTATLSVLRKHQALEIPVRLIAPPETPPAQKTELTGAQPLAGATVANLSPALAEELQLLGEWRGVVIVQIQRGATGHAPRPEAGRYRARRQRPGMWPRSRICRTHSPMPMAAGTSPSAETGKPARCGSIREGRG